MDYADWGKHYTWPASSLPFQLSLARQKVMVKQKATKEEKQEQKQEGGKKDF